MTDTQTENIYQLLDKAREIIRSKEPKVDGENEFSKYKYFTPAFVEKITSEACKEVGCICVCDLDADEYGLYQEINFINLSKPDERITTLLRTKHGEITATNEAQQMGGTDTYSERYLKMKLFGIKDNSSDPDSKDHKPKAEKRDEVTSWFDPKNEQHAESVFKYRSEGMSGEDIVKKIRSTDGFGISKKNAQAIIDNSSAQ
jgi:hypothetical protein